MESGVRHLDVAEAWPTNALRDFDASLRCAICSDFFELPVSFRACRHAFCSACARRSLPVLETCPMCREPATEGDLMPNKALEHAVECFKRVRDELLEATLSGEAAPSATAARPERKVRNQRQQSLFSTEVNSDSEDSDAPIVLSGGAENARAEARSAPCPVCNASIAMNAMNTHLNTCLVRREALSSPSRKRERSGEGAGSAISQKKMPKLAYHLFTLNKLREMCKNAGLAANGDKKQLEARHKEFTTRVNAIIEYGRVPDLAAIAREVNREEARKVGAGAKARIRAITATPSSLNSSRRFEIEVRRVRTPAGRTLIDNHNDDEEEAEEERSLSEDEILPLSQAAPRYVPTDDDEE
ncbi:hypothetical protein BE221DRAFT_62574 [Ostreococcus tauri]|uniref:RING-type E3 ubiquitin transferase n=1 Tax=Ostreococcus tauri TaxID=70448 RepID=A0A1Y5I656_OSTTA|nr:hypothetical protein BE221DRAFT_62574 [Ostreococcus tauri]